MPAAPINWLAPFFQPRTWLLVAGNSIPLFGVFYLGWDAPALLILYWLETAIIGFWMIFRVLRTPGLDLDTLGIGTPPPEPAGDKGKRQNIILALFFTAHAGIFMAVHLFLLNELLPGAWSKNLGSPIQFATAYIIPTGIWLPLVGFFVFHGIITASDMRNKAPLKHTVVEFYSRIMLMQFVVIFGGFLAQAAGSSIMLVLLIAAKTALDIYWEAISARVTGALKQPGAKPG